MKTIDLKEVIMVITVQMLKCIKNTESESGQKILNGLCHTHAETRIKLLPANSILNFFRGVFKPYFLSLECYASKNRDFFFGLKLVLWHPLASAAQNEAAREWVRS